jgi:Uma2 family endonuclease
MTNGTATLEPVATPAPAQLLRDLEPGVPIRLCGLNWNDYLGVSNLIGDRPLRTFYSDGEMEILMPSYAHEIWIVVLDTLIKALASELSMPLKGFGTSTFRRDDLEKGLESDRCYYLTNAARVRGKMRLDLGIDPPPDLAVEIEISRSAAKRMPIYAALRVPEVWRFDGETLKVHQLVANGEYLIVERSQYFPYLPIEELVRFVKMQDQLDDTELDAAFRAWVREQIARNWKNS